MYVYYLIYRFYKVLIEDLFKDRIHSPGAYALGVLSILQLLNIFSVIIIFSSQTSYNSTKIITPSNALIAFISLLFIDYIVFYKLKSYEKLDKKWSTKKRINKIFIGILVSTYILGSVILAGYCFTLYI